MNWIDKLDIVQSAYVLQKKVENKHCEQVNFVYDFMLVHTRGPVRLASLWIAGKDWTFGTNQNSEWVLQFGTDLSRE